MSNLDVKKVYGDTLLKLIEKDKNIMVVDADLMRVSGNQAVHDTYPEQYVQVGIAEQDMIGVAAGLAAMGKTVFTSAFANFTAMRSCDQITNSVCYNDLNVKMCGLYSGLTSGINGGTHISVCDVAIMRSIPTLVVVDPGDGIELGKTLELAAMHEGPVYIRIPKGPMPTIFDGDYEPEWGKGHVIEAFRDITLITTGVTTVEGIRASALLKEKGIAVGHIHLPFIKPVDSELLLRAAEQSKVLVTAENHSVVGGLGGAVAEVISETGAARLVRLGVNDIFAEGRDYGELLEEHGVSADAICSRVEQLSNSF